MCSFCSATRFAQCQGSIFEIDTYCSWTFLSFLLQLGLLSIKGQFLRPTLVVVDLFFFSFCPATRFTWCQGSIFEVGTYRCWYFISCILQLDLLNATVNFRPAPPWLNFFFFYSATQLTWCQGSISEVGTCCNWAFLSFVLPLGLLGAKDQFLRTIPIVVVLFFLLFHNLAYLVLKVNFEGPHLLWLDFSFFYFATQLTWCQESISEASTCRG